MSNVANVYAKAIFEFAQEKGQLDKVAAELKSFAEVCDSNESLRAVLAGAGINPNDRNAISKATVKALGLSPLSARFIELLSSRGRTSELSLIIKRLETMIEGAQGTRSGEVRSAVEMSAEELSVLASSLAKRVGGKVRLTQTVDPSLLGGMVATVAGQNLDASLRSQIERFRNELV